MSIPKIIVQTHRDSSIGQLQKASWKRLNPRYEHRFYDDAASRNFIEKQFPNLLATYDKLSLPVQKADLFRYAVIFMEGGVYTDVDTICVAPIDSYVDMQAEHFVVGMEMTPAQYGRGIEAYVQNYCTPFQLLQWTFAASPHHPALASILRRIDFVVSQMSQEQLVQWSRTSRFTLELTGPMAFTQALVPYLSGELDGRVTVLPRLMWGSIPFEQRRPEHKDEIKVQHLFEGSWRPHMQKPAAGSTDKPSPVVVNYSVKL